MAKICKHEGLHVCVEHIFKHLVLESVSFLYVMSLLTHAHSCEFCVWIAKFCVYSKITSGILHNGKHKVLTDFFFFFCVVSEPSRVIIQLFTILVHEQMQ